MGFDIEKNPSLILVALLMSTGCAATPDACDPSRNDGFLQSAGCLASGSYETRQSRLETNLAEERELNQAFRDMLASIEREKRRTRARLDAKQIEYLEIDRAWRALREQLAARSRHNQRLAAQIQRMNEQVGTLGTANSSGDVERRRQELDDLRRRVSLLQRELEAGIY